jgi:hypothetical protein
MINLHISNPVIYYSLYGYVQVDKNEYSEPEKQMISFKKINQIMTGTTKVKKLIIFNRKTC